MENPIKHFIYSLNVDTGATNPNWPVDVNTTATYNGMTFDSFVQEERGGLALVNGIVYVFLLRLRWWLSQLPWLGGGRGHQ